MEKKEKKGSKIVIIGVAILAAIVLLVAGYSVYNNKVQENKIADELEEITKITGNENYNQEELNKVIERTVTTGEYAKIEKAAKTYAKDIFKYVSDIKAVAEDKRLVNVLTIDNYKKDGPDFKKTKAYLTETKKTLTNVKTNMLASTEKEKIMEYAKNQKLSSRYEDTYEKIMIGDGEIISEEDKKEFEESIDQLIDLLNVGEETVNFLSKNKGKWQVKGKQIYFTNQSLINEYNKILSKIK